MNTIVTNYLTNLEFGELQQFENMGVMPLVNFGNHSPDYMTLKEALEKKLLTVTEISADGSVPELRVSNEAEQPVLILDGEELVGAKQNRIVNTTILLKKKSETVIPVSCTEQGRWSYISEEFTDSGVVASPKLRMKKAASVNTSLAYLGKFMSDQGAIWEEIDQMSAETLVHSPTSAMRDVFESRQSELEDYVNAFPYLPNQQGLLVFINGEVTGCDMISRLAAYKTVHRKLVKSYALEALLQKEGNTQKPSIDKAKTFLAEAMQSEEKKYKSIGQGWDYRYQGKAIVGSALVYRKKVIHAAFFRTVEKDQAAQMAGYRRRRGFRI